VNGELRVRERQLQGNAFGGLDTRWQMWQNLFKSHADS
jgi:hypothetical protein